MHLFKNFFRMLSKYKSGIIIYGVIFVVMIAVLLANGLQFGAVKDKDSTNQVENDTYTIGYTDNSDSELSRGLLEYLGENNELVDMSGKTEDNIKTMVFFVAVTAYIDIDEDFEAKALAGDEDAIRTLAAASDGPSSYVIESMINNYIKTYKTYLDLGFDSSEAIEKTADNLKLNADATVFVPEGSDSTALDHSNDFIIGTACKFFIYISFSAITLCVGGVLVKNNSGKVAERIKASPVKPNMISLTNTAGLIVCGIVLWVIMSIVVFALGGSSAMLRLHPAEVLIILLVSVVCNCSMASFISSFNLSDNVMPMAVNIIGLGLSFISGVFVPQYLMDPVVLSISKFLPFYWAVRVIDSLCPGSGSELEFTPSVMLTSCGIILLAAVVFAVGGALVRKNKKA